MNFNLVEYNSSLKKQYKINKEIKTLTENSKIIYS